MADARDRPAPRPDPPARRRRGGRRAELIVVAGAAALTVSCGETAPPRPPTPRPAAPADDRAQAEQQALAAYRAMWQAYARAGRNADADAAELAVYADGTALDTLQNGLAAYRASNQVILGRFTSAPRVTDAAPAAAPTSVEISDCLDGTTFLVYDRAGRLADDQPGERRSATATAQRTAGAWKVIRFAVQEAGTC